MEFSEGTTVLQNALPNHAHIHKPPLDHSLLYFEEGYVRTPECPKRVNQISSARSESQNQRANSPQFRLQSGARSSPFLKQRIPPHRDVRKSLWFSHLLEVDAMARERRSCSPEEPQFPPQKIWLPGRDPPRNVLRFSMELVLALSYFHFRRAPAEGRPDVDTK
jgi:hypothetical protein